MADLMEDWLSALREAVLSPKTADRLVTQVTALSARGSHLIVDYARSRNGDSGAERLATLAEQVKFNPQDGFGAVKTVLASSPSEPPDQWFPRHGWRIEAATLNDEAHRFGRSVPRSADPSLGLTPTYLVDVELPSARSCAAPSVYPARAMLISAT